MKKLLIVVTAFVVFSMLASTVVVAEPTHPNEVGLYMTPDGYGATGTPLLGSPVLMYLVLTKPSEVDNGDAPYPTINAFEATLRFEPIPNNNLFLLGANLPPLSVDVGLRKYINEGYLDYVVGIDITSPVPVSDESVVLITFQFMNMAVAGFNVYLEPTDRPSIPGQMAFQSIQGILEIMHPVSGSHVDPVFIFGGEAVAVENESFGSVKALYR